MHNNYYEFLEKNIEQYWDSWLKDMAEYFNPNRRLRSTKIRFKNYIHFSYQLTSIEEVKKLKYNLLNKEYISKHSFNPLLFFIKRNPIFERLDAINKDGKRYKKLTRNKLKPWKNRPLMYADHLDSLIQSWYSYILSIGYEIALTQKGLSDVVVAYRKDDSKRTNSSIAKDVFSYIKTGDQTKEYAILLFDVRKFYDTLDVNLLKKGWANILGLNSLPDDHFSVFKGITEYSAVNKGEISMYLNNKGVKLKDRKIGKICTEKEFHEMRKKGLFMKKHEFLKYISPFINPQDKEDFFKVTQKIDPIKGTLGISRGVPQGLVISPLLANIYMLNFDIQINNIIKKLGGIYKRYADDIVIVCDLVQIRDVENLVKEEICKLDLVIQSEKTQRYKFFNGTTSKIDGKGDKYGFTYLGLTQRGNMGYIRNGTLSKGHQKIRTIIRQAFGRKKAGEKITSKEVKDKVLSMGIFKYIKLCSNDHGDHIFKQFSKKRIKKFLDEALKEFDEYKNPPN